MKQFYTYEYKDVNGNTIYIGKGFGKRAWKHFCPSVLSQIGRYLRKRACEGLTLHPTLTYHKNELTALALEIFWIKVHGRLDLRTGTLFNKTDGGETTLGYLHSVETKEKLRLAKLGRPNSIESNLKNAVSNSGRKMSPNTKAALRKCHVGAKRSEESKALMSFKRKGRIVDPIRQKEITAKRLATFRNNLSINK